MTFIDAIMSAVASRRVANKPSACLQQGQIHCRTRFVACRLAKNAHTGTSRRTNSFAFVESAKFQLPDWKIRTTALSYPMFLNPGAPSGVPMGAPTFSRQKQFAFLSCTMWSLSTATCSLLRAKRHKRTGGLWSLRKHIPLNCFSTRKYNAGLHIVYCVHKPSLM